MNYILKPLITIAVLAITSGYGIAIAESVCDIALASRAFNISDIEQSSEILSKKRDDLCKTEYFSQENAISSGNNSGLDFSGGGYTLGITDTRQSANRTWSIADSKFCKASAEELNSSTRVHSRKQITDRALQEWGDCIKATANRLFVKYSLNSDGSGITGQLYRGVSANGGGGFGTITGIANSDPATILKCQIGLNSAVAGDHMNVAIIKSPTNFSCNKNAAKNIKMSLITSEGDQIWIDLPSEATLNKRVNQQDVLLGKNETIEKLNKEIVTLNNKLNNTIDHGNENRKLLVSHGYETIIEFFKGYVNLILGTYTGAAQFTAGKQIAMNALKKTQHSEIFSETGSIKQSIQLLEDPGAIENRAILQTTLGAAFVDMDKALKDFSNRSCC